MAAGLLVVIMLFALIAIAGLIIGTVVLNRSWGRSLDNEPSLPPTARPRDSVKLTGDVEADARALLRTQGKLEAIRRVRELTTMGLQDAKNYVEALENGESPAAPDAGDPLGEPLAPTELAHAARVLKAQGKAIAAIKLVREQTGWGLKEAKDYVDTLR